MKTKILITLSLLASATYAAPASAEIRFPELNNRQPRITQALMACARAKGYIQASENGQCFYLVNEGEGVTLREFHAKTGVCAGADVNTSPARAFFSFQKGGRSGVENAIDEWSDCRINLNDIADEL